MSNPLKKLASQTAIYGLSSIVGRFLNYLLTPLWTKYYSTEQFGIITEMYAYVSFLVVLLTYGMETAYFKYCNKPENSNATVFSTILISVVSTSVFFIVMCSFFAQGIADWLLYPDNTEFVVWFAIIVGVDAIASIPLAKLRQENKSGKFALVNIINVVVNIGLNCFFILYCKGIYDVASAGITGDAALHITTNNWLVDTFYNPEIGVGYVFIANLIASLTKFLVLIPESINSGFQFDKIQYRRMVRYAAPLLLVGLAGIVNETIDRIMLKRMLLDDLGLTKTMQQLGIYGANYKLSIVITLFIQAFRYAAEPFFFAQEKNKGSKEMYARVMNYFIIVVSTMFLFVLLYLDIFKYFISNEEFWVGLRVVPILLMANIFLGVYFNLSIWYKLSSKTGFGALISIFGAVVTIIMNFILIPTMGYMGSAWATLLCYASMVVVSYLLAKNHYPIPYNVKKAGIYISSALIFFFVSMYVKEWNSEETHYIINTLLLLSYIGFVFYFEKNKFLEIIPVKKNKIRNH